MNSCAMICGSSGLALTQEEVAFFRETRPAGFILFARNCDTPDQIGRLIDQFRNCAGRETLILIDQEGGRIQRLAPPLWPQYPTARRIGEIYDQDRDQGIEAARLASRLIGDDLCQLGINMDCLPVLDLSFDSGHKVIGDRAYHRNPQIVSALGRAACEGLFAAGILPVIKHIPGHGRAAADSHEQLPEVSASLAELADLDFVPFKALADMPAAMTAHILYTNLDAVRPATTSRYILDEVIRRMLGFDGLLMSDDVSMGALSGTIGERVDALFDAGCDIALHCNGDIEEMEVLAAHTPELAGTSKARFDRALNLIEPPEELDRELAWQRLRDLLKS
ncbi:MAG: beta-N-acetylhexosaminidase [Fimbriimonadaceae bacterium]|nr:beta-N-acetylhexosaminidase [Alphaproteobacteria bacterium]